MTIQPELWLLDTNVWVFGLRSDLNFVECRELLDEIGAFHPLVPLQVLRELNAVLSEDEILEFYTLVKEHPGLVRLDWTVASRERTKVFESLGCKKGDAVIAAHAEQWNVKFVVSENRQFLQTFEGLPFEIISPATALTKLRSH